MEQKRNAYQHVLLRRWTATIVAAALLSHPQPAFAAEAPAPENLPSATNVSPIETAQLAQARDGGRRRGTRYRDLRTRETGAVQKRERAAPKKLVQRPDGEQTAVLESMRRDVRVRSGKTGEWRKASRNATLGKSDRIETGRRSMARVKLADGSKVLLLQNSQAELENLSTVQKTIRLLRGRVRAIVRKLKNTEAFTIQTPIGVASVRGTEFEVEFEEGDEAMTVEVLKGSVAVAKLGDLADEVILNPGESLRFDLKSEIGDPIRTGAVPLDRSGIRQEVQIARVKEGILAQAAVEARDADYQVGKSLIDVDGSRVRVEEYITRPAANQFKLVAINERASRFDYFTYLGTVNKTLPEDLSVALRDIKGTVGDAPPEYHLTAYESVTSNTIDSITDQGTGGHLVKIEFDGTSYVLTDHEDGTVTRSVDAAVLQGDGSYKIYNPAKDKFSLVSADNLAAALKVSVNDAGIFRNLASGDTLWRTRFNASQFAVNGVVKTAFSQKTAANTLAVDLDANFTNAPVTSVLEFPSGTSQLHNRLSLFYSDGTKLVYDNYIIDDEGKIADIDRFSGVSTSAEYQSELLNWNYQQKVTADEMDGRSINLVIDPRIGTISGLIQ